MGEFLDRGNKNFRDVRKGKFVDKSATINTFNESIDTEQRYICVSRPRRFGKTLAAKMLYAYYDRSCDSHALFDDLEIASLPSYETHLNKYPTIFIDWNRFSDIPRTEILTKAQQAIICDLKESYPFVTKNDSILDALAEINKKTGDQFVMIIDEWDTLVRDVDKETQDNYVNFLRSLFKSVNANDIFHLVYMTGILPIIKIETQSALNNFIEYSIVDPGETDKYYGFTKEEVIALCDKYQMNFELMEHAYDGYIVGNERHIFNPNSVINSIIKRNYGSFWSKTAAFTAIERYIHIDADNVRQRIIRMLNGESVSVEITSFRNDMKTVTSYDDVLTLLIHLGYLSYDPQTTLAHIPNNEVAGEFKNAVKDAGWDDVSRSVADSFELLNRTISQDADYIARAFDRYRFEASSLLEYNDENSMACAIRLAYYSASSYYKIFRELPTGKGFADMVFVPLPNSHRPAIVVELKFDQSADTAISQIHRKDYPASLAGFSRQILLVGINYDKKTSKHTVLLESLNN